MSGAEPNPLRRILVPPPFRFDMGLRRSDGTFFRNGPEAPALLESRRQWMAGTPHRYAAALPEALPLLEDTLALAESLNGPLPGVARGISPAAAETLCEELGGVLEPDYLLLAEEDTDFRLLGGSLCFPSSWSLEEKLGRPLEWIHAPVPGLNGDYAARIQSFLKSLRPGTEWERSNWGIAATPALNLHPVLQTPRPGPDAALQNSWLRVEHQALRRLPVSGGILFGIRIAVYRLDTLAPDSALRTHLAELLETMPPAVAEYKGLAAARPALIRQLRADRRLATGHGPF